MTTRNHILAMLLTLCATVGALAAVSAPASALETHVFSTKL